jgi:hypothetical protein
MKEIKMIKKIAMSVAKGADAVVGKTLIGGAAYLVQRVRALKIVGAPVRALDVMTEWVNHHWKDGTHKAVEVVAVNRALKGLEALQKAGTRLTPELIFQIATQHGAPENVVRRLQEMADENVNFGGAAAQPA